MFERNVAYLASRGREVRIRTHRLSTPPFRDVVRGEGADGEDREYVGFIAGLDEFWLQLCLTETQYMVQIDRLAIATMEDTGRTLYTYTDGEFDEGGEWIEPMDAESIKRLKMGTRPFARTAHAGFEEGRNRSRERNIAASST